jgi:crossover junction endodeoxyribonuclease RuvC
MRNNRIISIDPGFDRFGVAVLEKETGLSAPLRTGKEKLLFSTCMKTEKKGRHEDRLFSIGNELSQIIKEWRPEALAMEKLFFNANVNTALKVAEARGVALYEAARAGLQVYEYSPQEVKIALTSYGRASKSDIKSMLGRLIELPERRMLDDELDAVAVGITHLASVKSI